MAWYARGEIFGLQFLRNDGQKSEKIGHEELELKGSRTIKTRTRKVKFTWGIDSDWLYGMEFFDE
jgi:hypothetical protein